MTEPDNDRLKNDRLKNDRLKDDRLSRSNISGLLAGLAVQPLVAALLAFVVFPIVDYSQGPLRGRPADGLDAAIAFAFGAAIVAVAVTLLGAFPIVAWRSNRGPFTLTEVLWWGVALGNAPLAIIAVLAALNGAPSNSPGSPETLRGLIAGSVVGFAGAAVFWVVAVRGSVHDARRQRHMDTG